MKGIIQVKSHLEIIRDLILFTIHKLCQVWENKENQFDDEISTAAQYDCNHSVRCLTIASLELFLAYDILIHQQVMKRHEFSPWDWNPYGSADIPWDQHFDSGLPEFQPGWEKQTESLSGKLSGELARWNRGQQITILSHGIIISTSRPLTPPLTQSW